jgi:acyl transferase domain-containing protein
VAKNQYQGQMIAVGLSAEDVAPYLDGFKNKVTIAAINSPTSITVSGDPDAIQALAQTFDGEGIFNRILNTGNNAYHSHHMLALGDSYEQLTTQSLEKARTIISKEVSSHSVRMVSSVEPDNKSPCMSPRYWRRNLESPVLFSQAVEALAREVPINLMIEIGPHPALNGPLKQIRLGMEQKEIQLPPCLASLRRGEHDVITMLNLAGNLFLHNAPVNLVAVNATEKVQQRSIRLQHGLHCIDMPQYRFAYPEKPIYYESRLNREYRQRKYPRHDLLGARVPGTSKLTPSWRNVIRIKDLPWLGDHKLSGHAVLPAAAYIAMAIEAASQFYEEEVESLPSLSFKLRHVSIYAALPLADDELGIETVLSMEKVVLTNTNATSAWYKFSITSTVPNSDVWIEHCAGTISAQSEVTAIDSHQRLRDDSRFRGLSMKRWYERFETIGLEYGSHFQGLSNLRAYHRVNIAAANVDLCPTQGSVKGDESRYLIHPAALDTCLQIALIAAHAGQAEYAQNAFIPVAIEEMSVWVPQSSEETALGVATGNMTGQRSLYARTQLYCPSGAPLLDIQELKCTLYDGAAPDRLSFIREPYWRTVVRVDVDSLTNDHAQVLSPPLTVPQSKLDSIDNLVAGALSKTKSVNGFDNQAENHDAFLTWVQSITYSEAIAPATAEQLQDTPEIKCINLLSGSLKSILNGERTSLEVLMQDQALHELETSGCLVEGGLRQLRFLVDLLAHKNPRMNILELDAGLGGATKSVLDALQSNSAFKRFNRFTITDSRQIFVADAELRFEGHHGLSFARLNIQDDFQTQGLEAHSFDLIIAASTIGQGDYTKDTLRKIHSLLKPNGRLAILRTIRPRLCSEFFTRIITGKWSEPCLFLPETGWSERLQKCGFSGIDVSLDDVGEASALFDLAN